MNDEKLPISDYRARCELYTGRKYPGWYFSPCPESGRYFGSYACPSWFHRTMQKWLLGFEWKHESDVHSDA